MNSFEALNEQMELCDKCRMNSFIIEFHELPEEWKEKFDYYDKDEHYLLSCVPCEKFIIVPESINENNNKKNRDNL